MADHRDKALQDPETQPLVCSFGRCVDESPPVPATWKIVRASNRAKDQVGRGCCDKCLAMCEGPWTDWTDFAVQRIADGYVRTSAQEPPPVAGAPVPPPVADPRPPQYAGWTVADLMAERDRLDAVVTAIWGEAKRLAAAREECQKRLDAAHRDAKSIRDLILDCEKHDGTA